MSGLLERVFPIVLGVALIAGGGYLYTSNQQATANADAVDATVLSADVYDEDPGDPPNDQIDDTYRASIEYRYTYAGETYTSESLCPGAGSGCAPTSERPEAAERFIADYPEGSTVTAYVQPDDPATAYLVEGSSPLQYLGLSVVGVLVTILGIRNLRG